MYTKEQQIEKIKRFISEKEDDIKYLKEKLAELLNEDIDKKEINENDDLFEKINAPWKTSFNRVIYSCFSEEIPQKIKDFVSFDNNILNKVIEKYKSLPTKEDSENLNGKTFDYKKQYQNDKDTKLTNAISALGTNDFTFLGQLLNCILIGDTTKIKSNYLQNSLFQNQVGY